MTAASDVSSDAIARARWRPAEIAFWILAASCAFLFPSRYLIMTDIVRLALFTLSLDLISAMPASSRWGTPRSSASAPIRQGCWRCTASSTSR